MKKDYVITKENCVKFDKGVVERAMSEMLSKEFGHPIEFTLTLPQKERT